MFEFVGNRNIILQIQNLKENEKHSSNMILKYNYLWYLRIIAIS